MNVPSAFAAIQIFCTTLLRRIAGGTALMHILLIIALGLAIYANTFRVPFLFDDIPCIAQNSALGAYFDSSVPDRQRYAGMDPDIINSMQLRSVTYLTFALNYRIHGFDVAGYHAVNLLIHLATAVLVYLLMVSILMTPFFLTHVAGRTYHRTLPLTVALLFVCHPVQASAVTYITQRFTSLAALLYLLSLLLYLKSRMTEGGKLRMIFLAGSVSTAILGMYTKEILFTLPAVAIVCELLFLRGSFGTRMKSLAPLLCTMLIIPINTLSNADAAGGIMNHLDDSINLANLTGVSQWDYFCTQLRVIITYLRLLVLPVNLHIDYDYPRYRSIMAPPVLVSALFLVCIALSGGWAYLRSRTDSPSAPAERLFAFGVAWFFITISMSSSIIPLDDMIFEYRLYLPSTGFFLAVAALVLLARQRLEGEGVLAGRMAAAGMVMVTVSLAIATVSRNHVWRSTISFWEDNVAKAPRKSRPHYNLGTAYVYGHRIPDAISQYREAVRLAPTRLSQHISWYNIARCQEELGKLDEAFVAYEKALQIKPYDYETVMHYGQLLATVGRWSESQQQSEIAESLRTRISYRK
ncbi:MAG: tetratricopeptide repeat protein [Desulfuromonadaceae bacterium]